MNIQLSEKRPRIFFTGVGGQGTLTATKLLAQTAMASGIEAVAGEVHGMAQRGGIVESTLLLGGWRAPRLDLGEADIILGFEPLESLRSLPYLAPGGIIFSALEPIPPLNVSLGKESYPEMVKIKEEISANSADSYFVPCREIGESAGSRQAGNTALLGALCASGYLPFGVEALLQAIATFLPARVQSANIIAAQSGADWFMKNREAAF